MVSLDGISFQIIHPDDLLTLPSPFWYQAVLTREDKGFQQDSSPLRENGPSPYYQVGQITTLPSGSGLIERVLVLANVTGPVGFRDLPRACLVSTA